MIANRPHKAVEKRLSVFRLLDAFRIVQMRRRQNGKADNQRSSSDRRDDERRNDPSRNDSNGNHSIVHRAYVALAAVFVDSFFDSDFGFVSDLPLDCAFPLLSAFADSVFLVSGWRL